jgi:alpha-tubulin suppressor-like RCC1 family protein
MHAGAATWYVSGLVTNVSPYRFSAIASGASHSLAIETNGTVLAWPQGFGLGNVPTNLTGAIAVAANDLVSLALLMNGTVVVWGVCNPYVCYTNLPRSLTNLVAIAAQGSQNLGLRSDGTVVNWVGGTIYTNGQPDLTDAVAIAGGS